jgi:putative endonuclease
MYYIYIIHSLSADKFYVGFSQDPHRRLLEHNTIPFSTFTSKHRPWSLKAVWLCGTTEKEAVRMERFIKKQKSRKLLAQLCDGDFVPSGELAQLVRVPHVRD